MRQVLQNSSSALSRRAAEQIEMLMGQATTDPVGTILRATRAAEWWTYAGLKANAALVQRFGLPATFDSLTIRARCTPVELNRALDSTPSETLPEIDERFRPKFAECLPDHLLTQFARERLYDWDAVKLVERTAVMDASWVDQ